MKSGRYLFHIMLVAATTCLFTEAAFAGFGFGGNDTGKSGLDFNLGYDINTVATISGRVAALPTSHGDAVTIAATSGSETIHLYVGPSSYWIKSGIQVNLNDEIIVKGSKAQGKDGNIYVLAQKLVNRTSGAQMELRTAAGHPRWLSEDRNPERSSGSQNPSGIGIMHGGGMMRSGGGGMMRH